MYFLRSTIIGVPDLGDSSRKFGDTGPQVLVGRKALSLAALACLRSGLIVVIMVDLTNLTHFLFAQWYGRYVSDTCQRTFIVTPVWFPSGSSGLGWGMVCNNRDTLIRPTPKRGYSAPATKGLTSINRLWPRTIGQIFHIEGLGWITDLPCRSLKESGGGRGTPWTWQKHGVFGWTSFTSKVYLQQPPKARTVTSYSPIA